VAQKLVAQKLVAQKRKSKKKLEGEISTPINDFF
jgi:hypothetical protein